MHARTDEIVLMEKISIANSTAISIAITPTVKYSFRAIEMLLNHWKSRGLFKILGCRTPYGIKRTT